MDRKHMWLLELNSSKFSEPFELNEQTNDYCTKMITGLLVL